MAAAFVESNPIPAKAALAAMGRCANVLRLPLVPLADAHARVVATRCARPTPSPRSTPRDRQPARAGAPRPRGDGDLPGAALPSHAATTVEQLLTALERGELRAARRGDDGVWHAVPWVKRGILLAFRAGAWSRCRSAAAGSHSPFHFFDKHTVPARALRLESQVRVVPGRLDDPPRHVPGAGAWCACRRCTSTSARWVGPGPWSTRTRWSARARRSASACT
jgi:hypothetical protein